MRRPTILVAAALAACAPSDGAGPGDSVRVTIPPGATLRAAAESLAANGVVESARVFRFYARLTGRHRLIQAGTFHIPRGSSIRAALDSVRIGRAPEQELTILESMSLREAAARIFVQLGIPEDSTVAAASDTALRRLLDVPTPTVEGYLYPSTYRVRVGASAAEVVRTLAAEFEQRWRPEWNARLEALGMSRHEIVTLASIIEGEVRYAPDRRYVSSVYHNRLRAGMRLQADPTVVYTLGRRRRLYEKDYQRRSPYNTYQVDGLPPGPIGSPSEASIEAALYPAATDFLYFVARADGKHVFSRTYGEHLRAIREIRGR